MGKNLLNNIEFDPKLDKLTPLSRSKTSKTFILHKDITYFVKYDQNESVIYSEYKCLHFLDEKKINLFPKPFGFFNYSDGAYLICEFINFKEKNNFYELGKELAKFHQNINSNYGFFHDTHCGPTLQVNSWNRNWYDFFFNTKIKYQLDLAIKKKHVDKNYSKIILDLLKKNKSFFTDRTPSLIHGDLWSGNIGTDIHNRPRLFDPSLYYGDYEADIAMTELFGGFDQKFYEGYNHIKKFESGYKKRTNFYKLYHILNHLNIFGGSYKYDLDRIIRKIVTT